VFRQNRKLIKEDIIPKKNARYWMKCFLIVSNDDFLKELSGDPVQESVALRLLLSFFRDVRFC
jgi:hypothetical protein